MRPLSTDPGSTPFSRPPDWVADAVFYQIFPDRFARSERLTGMYHFEDWNSPPTRSGFKGGDLYGVVEHLDYLDDLGVTGIYLNPIFASASNHRYHTFDYRKVDPLLGGDTALRLLVDEAHRRGIRIILDGVFNHAGRGFWPFHHMMEAGPDSPYRDWFTVKGWPLRAYDPHREPNYLAWWGLPALPKLNVAHPDVRSYLLDIVDHWTRLGLDGWRLDVPQEIDDREFWRSFRRRVREANPDAYLVGEIWDEAPEWLEGDRFDGLMNYSFSRRALGFCSRRIFPALAPGGRRIRRLSARNMAAEIRHQVSCYRPETVCSQLNLLGSHDTARFLTQAGGDHRALCLAVILQMTLPGVPCVYYGDEIGMEGGLDPDCRRAFPWDSTAWHQETLKYFRRAVALRHRETVLRRGDTEVLGGHDGVLAYLRHDQDRVLLIILNVQAESRRRTWTLPDGLTIGEAVELWAEGATPVKITTSAAGTRQIHAAIPARSARIIDLCGPQCTVIGESAADISGSP